MGAVEIASLRSPSSHEQMVQEGKERKNPHFNFPQRWEIGHTLVREARTATHFMGWRQSFGHVQ